MAAQDDQVRAGLRDVRKELGIPDDFPAEVQAAAALAAESTPDADERQDLRDIPFVTIDPEGSMDLDQAVHVARDGDVVLTMGAGSIGAVPGKLVEGKPS